MAEQSKALEVWQNFQNEIQDRADEIATMLPRHISKDRFINSAIAAVKQNPELLTTTPRSLFAAVTQSAQDGLLPDGREGVITVYNVKHKENGKDVWHKEAKWNPMAWGMRKRARELVGMIIDAQVVHKGDDFMWCQGDEPTIKHVPAQLGTQRGPKIGAYAIFKDEGGRILHREVMDADQIGKVREQSKAKDSLMWTKFEEEGWKKTVLRRGIKSVPSCEPLEAIVQRDSDLYDMDHEPAPILVAPSAPKLVLEDRPEPELKPEPEPKGKKQRSKDAKPYAQQEPETGGAGPKQITDEEAYLDELDTQLSAAQNAEALADVWQEHIAFVPQISARSIGASQDMLEIHRLRIEKAVK